MILLVQRRRDRKETRARHYVRALNMKHTLEFVFIERYAAMPFCQLTKWPHKHSFVFIERYAAMLFCQLTKWPHKHTLCDAV